MKYIKSLIKMVLFNVAEHLPLSSHRYSLARPSKIPFNISITKGEEVDYDIASISCKSGMHKWVGGVRYENFIYGIPNSFTSVLKIDTNINKIDYIGDVGDSKFKWTGGCLYKGLIFGFPRSSNYLLAIDPANDDIKTLDIGLHYEGEHHYGGVVTDKGIIYQPPRNSSHILAIDLNNLTVRKIYLCPSKMPLKFRYCGSFLHPNGFIYFIPERGERVIVFNPDDESYFYIGKRLNCMVFNCALGNDNNLYGFSAYSKGILKIDTQIHRTEMICKSSGVFGCYGTKLAVDGKMYGIPGDTNIIWRFDSSTQTVEQVKRLKESGLAKCAGSVITNNGTIYSIPTSGNKIYLYSITNRKVKIPKDVLETPYYTGTY